MKTPHLAPKSTILAVDDQRPNLVALDAVLGDEYNMIFASSGSEAISIMKKPNDVDLILMDLQMPVLDGFETAKFIKQIEGCSDIPIIFITAVFKEDPHVKKGYEAGGVDYFSKPFDPEILKIKVAIYSSFRQRAAILKSREREIIETEELLKAGRKLSSVLATLPVGVLIADIEGRICQINEVSSQIFGATESIESDSYGQLLGWWDEDGQMIKDSSGPLARALEFGEVSDNEVMRIRSFDGTDKIITGSASPLRALDGHIMGAVIVIQDVTEPKRIERALEEKITNLVSLGVQLEQSVRS